MNTSSSSSSSLVLLLERAGVLESHEGGDPAQYKLVGLVFHEVVFSGSSGFSGVIRQIPYLATVLNRNCEGLVQSDLWLLGMNDASVKGDHSRRGQFCKRLPRDDNDGHMS